MDLLIVQAVIFFCTLISQTGAYWPWKQGGYRPQGDSDHHHHHHHHQFHGHHRPAVPPFGGGGPRGGPGGEGGSGNGGESPQTGCSCLLYVEQTEVFRRSQSIDANQRPYSCDRRGLADCSAYCNTLFSDEGLRARSRQDACDVLGRPIYSTWYRRNEVCGRGGPREDIPLTVPLCCRRGRTSLECGTQTGTGTQS